MKTKPDTSFVAPVRTLKWNSEMLDRFDKRLERAKRGNEDTFKFDDLDFYTPYAAYLSEYLHSVLK